MERLHHGTHYVAYSPHVAFGLFFLGPLFAIAALGALFARGRVRRWPALAIGLWALPWSLTADCMTRAVAWLHAVLWRAGLAPGLAGDSSLIMGLDIHVPIAVTASSLVTAGLLWWATRARTVLIAGAVGTVPGATLFLGPDLPVVTWPEAMAMIWMALIAGIMFHWAVANPQLDGALRRCAACGYDLTGNTTGTCPECGARMSEPRPT